MTDAVVAPASVGGASALVEEDVEGATSIAATSIARAGGSLGNALDRPLQARTATTLVASSITLADQEPEVARRQMSRTIPGGSSARAALPPRSWRQADVFNLESIDGPFARKVGSWRAQPPQNMALSRFAVWQVLQITVVASFERMRGAMHRAG